ncbi:adenylate/guanylate cyclase domain-containing protein [Mycobacterium colombiense]|uniref:adenylate/guanylate cyclase domain-containing protein n=1 Tax=Mycobacterium colombiense TaxID=339268 RepID=UPI0024B327A2|nr:adenylate/guanylate cyclase domain-containing protein [Mycobacterium colombiense]
MGDRIRGARQAAGPCESCGTELSPNSKFCHECGRPVIHVDRSAEYKQVTVLFADVVHSMDIAAAVGAERLREIMAELVDLASAVVQRYGGTLDKFTGDGFMALFGAPAALEDHAVRACLAALDIQQAMSRLAGKVSERDAVELQLRMGLNSGQVIAGEIGSAALGYTAIGDQVGMAQRMESVAPPNGVMLSASTARLVERTAVLGEPELVQIKGNDQPIQARRLIAVPGRDEPVAGTASSLVGRQWEIAAAEGLLARAAGGRGGVLAVAGPAGIGKSRLVQEITASARTGGVEVWRAYCESHTSEVSFQVVSRLLRSVTGIRDLDDSAARTRIRSQIPAADRQDLLLLDDLLGIAAPDETLPGIDPDARRRRLTALIHGIVLSRRTKAIYVIEDVHWIDEASESMLADFLAVIPQTASLALVTYRPEYRGALTNIDGSQVFALAPLSDSETSALVAELLGHDQSVSDVSTLVTENASGNPFFVEEMVRDLAERGILDGSRGSYRCARDVADVRVPATLQATLASRIDRLAPQAKRTLNAAAVIGSRPDAALLVSLVDDPEVTSLIEAELIEQVMAGARTEYAFRHPLIRAVAYESQLKSDRAELHRRLATVLEKQDPGSADDNAALIAEHREAAGDLSAAYAWRMRAGAWLMGRDVAAARRNWDRARQVADMLPSDLPDRVALRSYPRAMLCQTAWRVGSGVDENTFDELRTLCTASGNRPLLAAGLSGATLSLTMANRHNESARLASEQIALFDSVDDPMSMFVVMSAPMFAKLHAGEAGESLRVAQTVTDLLADDAVKGNIARWGLGSPLAVALLYRALARACLGDRAWRADLRRAIAIQRELADAAIVIVITYGYSLSVTNGLLVPDAASLAETDDVLRHAEKSGDAVALALAQVARGLVLMRAAPTDRGAGIELITEGRAAQLRQRNLLGVSIVDIGRTLLTAEAGDLNGAIAIGRATVEDLVSSGEMVLRGAAISAFVTVLLMRSGDADIREAETMIDRLSSTPTESGFVMIDIWVLRLRALLAQAHGDVAAYRDYRDRYRTMAASCGFEGHMAWGEAMP